MLSIPQAVNISCLIQLPSMVGIREVLNFMEEVGPWAWWARGFRHRPREQWKAFIHWHVGRAEAEQMCRCTHKLGGGGTERSVTVQNA